MFYYGDHTSGWGWLIMSAGMIVFWGLLIAGFALSLRAINGGQRPVEQLPGSQAPHEILAERFARGEIDETEYRARAQVLGVECTTPLTATRVERAAV